MENISFSSDSSSQPSSLDEIYTNRMFGWLQITSTYPGFFAFWRDEVFRKSLWFLVVRSRVRAKPQWSRNFWLLVRVCNAPPPACHRNPVKSAEKSYRRFRKLIQLEILCEIFERRTVPRFSPDFRRNCAWLFFLIIISVHNFTCSRFLCS